MSLIGTIVELFTVTPPAGSTKVYSIPKALFRVANTMPPQTFSVAPFRKKDAESELLAFPTESSITIQPGELLELMLGKGKHNAIAGSSVTIVGARFVANVYRAKAVDESGQPLKKMDDKGQEVPVKGDIMAKVQCYVEQSNIICHMMTFEGSANVPVRFMVGSPKLLTPGATPPKLNHQAADGAMMGGKLLLSPESDASFGDTYNNEAVYRLNFNRVKIGEDNVQVSFTRFGTHVAAALGFGEEPKKITPKAPQLAVEAYAAFMMSFFGVLSPVISGRIDAKKTDAYYSAGTPTIVLSGCMLSLPANADDYAAVGVELRAKEDIEAAIQMLPPDGPNPSETDEFTVAVYFANHKQLNAQLTTGDHRVFMLPRVRALGAAMNKGKFGLAGLIARVSKEKKPVAALIEELKNEDLKMAFLPGCMLLAVRIETPINKASAVAQAEVVQRYLSRAPGAKQPTDGAAPAAKRPAAVSA